VSTVRLGGKRFLIESNSPEVDPLVRGHRISEAQLARLLEGWCADSRESLHRQLAAALAALIGTGDLPAGALLPSERALARALAVSRGTLVSAYIALRGEGLLDSRQGSGTRVRGGRSSGAATPAARPSTPEPPADLSVSAPPGLDWVADVIASVTAEDLRPWVSGHGHHPAGIPPLRESLAKLFGDEGLPTEVEQIVVTGGARHGLHLVAGALLAPGDEVVVEDPTHRGALEVFRDRGVRLRTAPHREDGVDVEALLRLIRGHRPRLVYLLPALHDPVGVQLCSSAGRAIVDAAAEAGTTLVEDRSTADTLFASPPPAPLAALRPDAPVLTVGSLAQLFWGGLRVGWVRGAVDAVRRLVGHRGTVDLAGSVPGQLAARRLLTHLPRARYGRATALRAAHERITGLLAGHLPEWGWVTPVGGGSLWVRLPAGQDAVALAEAARRDGVLVTPGPTFSATDGQRDRLRLSFAVDEPTARIGVERLAAAWRRRPRG
jgi:DNA-binding transcriptional MocR family regulator